MTITIHANSIKNIKLMDRILVAGSYKFKEKEELVEKEELTVNDFREMIKARRPQILGKSLQNL